MATTPKEKAAQTRSKNQAQMDKLKETANNAKGPAPKFTYADVAAMINESTTLDAVNDAVSCMTDFPQEHKDELNALAETKRLALENELPISGEEITPVDESKQDLITADTTTDNMPEATKAPTTLKEMMLKRMPQIETLLPKHMTPERFMRVTFMAIQKVPDLLNCTKESVVASMLKCAEWGLLPDGRQGAMIPFNNRKKIDNEWHTFKEATFLPMYQGLIDLARRSGQIADIFPATIHEHDEFEYELGLNRTLKHKPKMDGDRGKAIAYYCVIELKDGTKTFGPGPMTKQEVEAIRARSKSPNSPAWQKDFDAMAWKTVIKRNLKFAPQSTEMAEAIDYDNEQDFGGEIDLGDIEIDTAGNVEDINKELLESKAS